MKRGNGMQLVQGSRETDPREIVAGTQSLAEWLLGLLRSRRGLREPQVKQLHIVETLSLGGRRQLMLVRCGEERFLVGGGPESVETIIPIKAAISPRAMAKDLDETCQ